MINNKIMNQAFLNEIKLKIPEDYLVADKNTILELVNERFENDEIHKDFLLPFMNMI